MKRFLAILLCLTVWASAAMAAGGTMNPDGSMTVVSSDQEGDTGSDGPTVIHNDDGSITIVYDEEDSNHLIEPLEDEDQPTRAPLEGEAWEERLAQAMRRTGGETATFLSDDRGSLKAVKVRYIGLGRSMVFADGAPMMVPTSSLVWETEAPEEKHLAVVSTTKQSYISLHEKKSQKSLVMTRIEKGKVLRVISTGKTWTMVDNGEMRGYVMTSGLTFYSNAPRDYDTGMITYKGKISSKNTVHVRSANTGNGRQLEEFACGTPLTIFEHDDKWCEIDVAGWHCYILTEFVTFDEAGTTAKAE